MCNLNHFQGQVYVFMYFPNYPLCSMCSMICVCMCNAWRKLTNSKSHYLMVLMLRVRMVSALVMQVGEMTEFNNFTKKI